MPSSGARSGTSPSRSERGAGDGRVGGRPLLCGHVTHAADPVAGSGRRSLWRCPEGCGLYKQKLK